MSNIARILAPKINLPKDTSVKAMHIDSTGKTLVIETNTDEIRLVTNSLIDTTDMNQTLRFLYPKEERDKVEKRFVIPNSLFEAIDFSKMNIREVKENKDSLPKFIIGEKYALRTPGCDGFEGTEKIYELVGFDDEFGGVKIDALIVKQISGECGNIFTLSKNDCNYLGVEYENGLQLFPKKLSWVHVKDVVDFNPNNLATTPTSDIDNAIRHIIIRLKGFSDYSDGYVLSPSGKLITEEQFERSIKVESNEPIVYGNGYVIQDHTPLNASIVHPGDCVFNHGNFISSEDEVFIHINLVKHDPSYPSHDNCFGVDPKYFDNVNPNEFFTITWDELGGVTVEEYEDIKRKKAEAEAKRAKEEEEERKRQIAEAEKALAEKRRLEALAVERMKNFRIKTPEPIAIPSFNNAVDPLVGIEMYIDDLDMYFKTIDTGLNSLTKNLNKIMGSFNFPERYYGYGTGRPPFDIFKSKYRL